MRDSKLISWKTLWLVRTGAILQMLPLPLWFVSHLLALMSASFGAAIGWYVVYRAIKIEIQKYELVEKTFSFPASEISDPNKLAQNTLAKDG